MTDQPNIFFMHIPKTAGSTVFEMIRHANIAQQTRIFPAPDDMAARYDALTPEALQTYATIAGHFDAEVFNRVPNVRAFTILRHPTHRIVSVYRYAARTNDPYNRVAYDKINNDGISIKDFVQDRDVFDSQYNAQTRQLAGYVWSKDWRSISETQLLKTALDNIERFAVIGFTERLDETMQRVAHAFNWSLPEQVESQKVSPGEKTSDMPLDAETLAAIDAINELDWIIYDHCWRRFEEQT